MNDVSWISLPETRHRTIEFAAGELCRYLNVMAGGNYPVRHEAGSGPGTLIRFALDQAQEYDGYTIQSRDEKIWITGGSPRGCLYGVYGFLRDLGCRFPLPGKKHEIVPKLKRISRKGRTIKTKPVIAVRSIMMSLQNWDFDIAGFVDYLCKNGYNSFFLHSEPVPDNILAGLKAALLDRDMGFEWGGHRMPGYLPRDLFGEHPDFFRMENGKRTPDLNMCPASSGAADAIARNAEKDIVKLRDMPGLEMLHFWPDDLVSGGFCGCEKCKGLGASDQALKIVNEIAARLDLKKDTAVAHLSYHTTLECPKTVRPNRNVRLFYAPRERCYRHAMGECETNKRYLERLKSQIGWFPDNPEVMEYYMDAVLFRQMPMPLHKVIGRDIKVYCKAGVKRITSLTFQAFGDWAYGMNYYVLGKALWRGHSSPEDIREFCSAVYGSQSRAMERYFDLLFELCATAMQTCGYKCFADMRYPPDEAFSKKHLEQLAPLVTEKHLCMVETAIKSAMDAAPEPCRTRISEQFVLWQVARLDTKAIYLTMQTMLKAKRLTAGKGTDKERLETIESCRQAIVNIREAAELLLAPEQRDIAGPHMFRDGGMVGGERLGFYLSAIEERIKEMNVKGASV